jgi:hypothetical protein
MESGAIIAIIQIILRIIGTVVCSNKAKELNRNTGGWGVFGFIMPIVAMIWIYCLKPIIKWDENMKLNK